MKRLNLILVRILFSAALFAAATAARAAVLFDQRPILYSTDYLRGINWQSKGGVPLSGTVGDPAGSDGRAPSDTTPTPRQFTGGIVYGAVTYQKSSNLSAGSLPANARRENLDWPRIENADGTIRLVLRAQIGAPYMMRAIAFFFGSIVPEPDVNESGEALSAGEQQTYWVPEPYTINDHEGAGYYWSPHAQRVYATQPGRIELTWRRRSGVSVGDKITGIDYAVIGGLNYALLSTNHVVSGATVKTPRKMYWTEGRFRDSGKPITVPAARVGDVKIVYNSGFPEFVGKENAIFAEGDEPYITNRTDRTLWYDATTTKQIMARNKEGRVFVELLGDVRGTGPFRNQLGFEIVDVVRQPTPADVTIELGERLTPPGEPASELFPEPLLSSIRKNFAFQHSVAGSDEIELFATRETKNLNDYQVFWMEESVAGLRWPAFLARYNLIWPGSPAKYSHYVRPAGSREEAKVTAVALPTENVPIIEYQDFDPQGNPRAALTEDFKFFTFLDSTISAHRTLLRLTSGDNIAFERVFSVLDSSVKAPGFDGSFQSATKLNYFPGPGVSGKALDLNPDIGNAYGQLPAGTYFDGSSFTVESWVFVRSTRNEARLIDFGNGPKGADNVFLALSDGTTGRPVFATSDAAGSRLVAPNALPLNEWVHLAFVFDAQPGASTGTGTIYQNGVFQISADNMPTPQNVNRANAYVGRSIGDSVTLSILDAPSGKISHTVRLSSEAPFLNGTNSRLFFGTESTEPNFDNLSIVTAVGTPQPASLIEENFDDGTLDSALEDPDSAFEITDGVIRRKSSPTGRRYIRTVASNFNASDWTYDLRFSANSGDIRFIGLGEGVRNTNLADEPRNAITLRIHGPALGSGVVHVAVIGETDRFDQFIPIRTIGDVGSGGSFTARIEKNSLGDGYADAQIDNLRIWSVARTPEQLVEDMKSTYHAGTSGLSVQYQFDDDVGPVAADKSGNSRAMNLINASLTDQLPSEEEVRKRARFVEANVWVGQRLVAPSGEATSGANLPYLAGYINKARGTGFSVTAYRDPFAEGFETAAAGAIIPVNAGFNNLAKLEVWWYRKNNANLAQGFSTIYWPSVIGHYSVQWPPTGPFAREIILASNDGSGGLESLEAKGTIYVQNDPALSGYNPNEEHALMLGGQAYALRDDLNVITSDGYTSDPYVLLEHSDGQGRPEMKVFKVLRERPEEGILFDYITEAGTPLQAPMPLPLLPKPVEGSGDTARNYNTEPEATNGDLPVNWSSQDVSGPYGHYRKFTFEDRKNQFWVYRGVHTGLPALAIGAYNSETGAIDAPQSATAIAGAAFTYHLHVSRRSESLILSAGPNNTLPAWLTIDNLSLTGTPTSDDVGTASIDLVLKDTRDDSQVTARLQLTVSETGSVVTQGPLEITSFNSFAGTDVTYGSRPPYLAKSPNGQNSFTMRFYYRTQAGFAWPGNPNPPPVDTIVPYLRPKNTEGAFAGDPTSKNTASLDIVYRPAWPSEMPRLQFGDTLTTAKLGLPAVRGQTSLQILYQQSIAEDIDTANVSAVLNDPTREKFVDLAAHNLTGPPPSVRTENFQGKVFFPNLPPHLVERLFYDPSRSAAGHLVFMGEFKDEPLGLKYVQLNVLRGSDLQAVKDLTPASDTQNKSRWDAAVDALATTLETFRENPSVPMTYIPDPARNVSVGIGALSEIHNSNTAVDSYALSASGPGDGFLTLVTANGSAFTPEGDPVSMHILRVTGPLVRGELKILPSPNPLSELLTIQHTSDLAGRYDEFEYEWMIAPPVDGFPPAVTESLTGWSALASGNGIPFYTLGGSGIQVLIDNYLIMRYRPKNANHPLFDQWSDWTEPQLAEGWIKRVLAGINPFNQRVTDLFNNTVNTDVSILTQAGSRWEGDVALNLETINNLGLIEIYETVLRRGKVLSIDSGINFGPANDALLLAAGYLNDLYMMLGNEAWADAANPTIGIGTQDKTFGDIATALFAFKGQMPSLLEEELALLRGRDDFLQPGVEISPVYNRLFWNYTRGIDSGEVIYALNYNIQENNDSGVNGVINADDARKMFPQGHGDAYGHYLTALKGYYSLLLDADFDWVPRIEAVTVLGKAVSVDYQDERKFAAAAAALARAGQQVLDLTWRKDYKPGASAGWKHFSATRTNDRRKVQTTRHWGVDPWASRTGQGAYLNWAMGNAILPAVDPDPSHEGIQKVDRTTVPELSELPAVADDLQTALDSAEGSLTPLGLPDGSLAFDLNPTEITGPSAQTHFEQIYGRAKLALNNALTAFDDAKDVTRLLRSEQDSLAELQAAVSNQELAYSNALIELYGTPYPDDIGPGKTYVQGYAGPDFIHYTYVEIPELNIGSLETPRQAQTYRIDIQTLPDDWITRHGTNVNFVVSASTNSSVYVENTHFLEFNLGPHGFFSKPATWTGKRVSPGKIQQAISEMIAAHNSLRLSLYDIEDAKGNLDKAVSFFRERRTNIMAVLANESSILDKEQAVNNQQRAFDIAESKFTTAFEGLNFAQEIVTASFPDTIIAGLAAGGNFARVGLGAIVAGIVGGKTAMLAANAVQFQKNQGAIKTLEEAMVAVSKTVASLQSDIEIKEAVFELGDAVGEVQVHLESINQRLRQLDDAQRKYDGLLAEGNRIQQEREVFRQRSAALVQGFRTRDAAFRIFRSERLERYKTLFDLAARYAFLAANAYDYETGLLNTQQGKEFINRIVNARALGVMRDGEPQFAGSNTGDPGLSSVLAEMKTDFDVLKGRLGFNNPNGFGTTVSLRMEKERIVPFSDGDATWQDVLERGRRANLLEDSDVLRHCMQIDPGTGLPVPGIVLEFGTTIEDGANLFGQVLAGGDHNFDTSLFATKIFSVGVAFEGYVGMDNPVANTSAVNAAGGFSPPNPSTTFLGSKSLSATPGIYLIPVGLDSMRSPPLGDASEIRTWNVDDVAIPLPFNIGGSDLSTKALWQSNQSLSEQLFSVRKHSAFRPVSTTTAFANDIYFGTTLRLSQFTNNRLIGRSVWNTKWKLVIPGHKLLGNPNEGLDRFIQTVKDIKLHFVTYSYAGN